MLCIQSRSTDPYFNLASEEYLLKCVEDDVFLLYINSPSIVVGKHQNSLAEINLTFVQKNNISVARRISGGGTVFHDLGNLNFCFITRGTEGELVNYQKFTMPIIEALSKMGLTIKLGKRNELLLNNLKISGTASHVFKQRVMHHGTLLFSSEMSSLSEALKVQPKRFTDRAVKSIRSKITNIRDHLDPKVNMESFQNHIYNYILNSLRTNISYTYTKNDLQKIGDLRDSKFSTWEWNFGYSPKYQFNTRLNFKSGYIDLHMNVIKGIIQEVRIEGDFMSVKNIHLLEHTLVGAIHDPETLRLLISGIKVEDYISGMENEELLLGMF